MGTETTAADTRARFIAGDAFAEIARTDWSGQATCCWSKFTNSKPLFFA